jgi:hypothetical protein
LFHGTIEQLLAHIGTPIPPEDVVTPQDKKDIAALVLAELPGALAGLTGAVGKLPADVWNFELVRRGDDWKPAKVNPSAAAHWFVEGKDITDRQRAAEALELGAQVSALATQVEGLVGLVRSLLPPAAK